MVSQLGFIADVKKAYEEVFRRRKQDMVKVQLLTAVSKVILVLLETCWSPGPGCSKDGNRYRLEKSLSGGRLSMFCEHLFTG